MSAKFFIDTNILVYSFDNHAPAKKAKAQEIINQALSDNSGVISFQVVQEFFNVCLRKFEKPFTVYECQLYLDRVLTPLCESFPSIDLYREALSVKQETGFGFYDSLIIASAIDCNCKYLYTEDLQHNKKISGLFIQNPFC